VRLGESQTPAGERRFLFGFVAPHAVSGWYRVALVAVVIGLILLPLVYVALILGVAWATYWYAFAGPALLEHLSGLWAAVVYVGPLIIGPMLVLFMVRPLFSRSSPADQARRIEASAQPELFELIEGICQSFNVPTPRSVYVDCQTNASASLRGGVRAFIRRELDLTVGIPLVGGLSVQQFAGVLAHEFGHFAQGSAMRLTYVIRTMNRWLARVAFQPDTWEQRLQRLSTVPLYFAVIVLAARAALSATRRVLTGLVYFGHLLSNFSLRQMEFDADRWESKAVGDETFASTMGRVQELQHGMEAAIDLLNYTARTNRLAEDLPALAVVRADVLALHAAGLPQVATPARRQRLLQTHPSDAERIRAVRERHEAAILRDARPASSLIRDFADLSRITTSDFYNRLAIDVSQVSLLGVDEICAGRMYGPRMHAAVSHLFGGALDVERPIAVAVSPGRASDVDQLRRLLKELDNEWTSMLPQVRDSVRRAAMERNELRIAHQAQTLAAAKIRFRPVDLGLEKRTVAAAEAARSRCMDALVEAETRCVDIDRLACRRLCVALELQILRDSQTDTAEGTADLAPKACRFASASEAFVRLRAQLTEFRTAFANLWCLLNQRKAARPRTTANRVRLEKAELLNRIVRELLPAIGAIANPLVPGETLLDAVRREFPPQQMQYEQQVLAEAIALSRETTFFYYQVIGELCVLAQTTA
jgi:Zn-dependent protease with chaperone function